VIFNKQSDSNDDSAKSQQYHVIQLTEVWLNSDYVILGNIGNIRRKRNKKFKGQGVMARVPSTL
jgi:hypothetical protein